MYIREKIYEILKKHHGSSAQGIIAPEIWRNCNDHYIIYYILKMYNVYYQYVLIIYQDDDYDAIEQHELPESWEPTARLRLKERMNRYKQTEKPIFIDYGFTRTFHPDPDKPIDLADYGYGLY
jgi:hypothetical protein